MTLIPEPIDTIIHTLKDFFFTDNVAQILVSMLVAVIGISLLIAKRLEEN